MRPSVAASHSNIEIIIPFPRDSGFSREFLFLRRFLELIQTFEEVIFSAITNSHQKNSAIIYNFPNIAEWSRVWVANPRPYLTYFLSTIYAPGINLRKLFRWISKIWKYTIWSIRRFWGMLFIVVPLFPDVGLPDMYIHLCCISRFLLCSIRMNIFTRNPSIFKPSTKNYQ